MDNQSGLIPVWPETIAALCRPGHGEKTCRYLVASPGFACAKLSALRATLDQRVEANALGARGDNCSGPPDFEESE